MIVYNKTELVNLQIREEVNAASDENCLSNEERIAITEKYPVGFYTPNFFIRAGLFLLTIIVLLFSFGLLSLIFLGAIENAWHILAIIFAIGCYASLEYLVKLKKHYQSGVDDALLWAASVALFSGIGLPYNPGWLISCAIIFMISLYGSLRYADRLMSVVCCLSLLGIVFFTCIKMGDTAKAIVPFIIMITALIVYLLAVKLKLKKEAVHYSNCLDLVQSATLISLYAAGNYYVVRELSNSMFDLQLQPSDSIPFSWLFWIFTVIIPVIYLAIGIYRKNILFIRAGLLLVAAIVFTIRYYHSILPVEIMMTIGGIILMPVAYWLTKYLHKEVHGFTSREMAPGKSKDKLQIESLIISQTFKPGDSTGNTKFGGGSFGGGGASGEY